MWWRSGDVWADEQVAAARIDSFSAMFGLAFHRRAGIVGHSNLTTLSFERPTELPRLLSSSAASQHTAELLIAYPAPGGTSAELMQRDSHAREQWDTTLTSMKLPCAKRELLSSRRLPARSLRRADKHSRALRGAV